MDQNFQTELEQWEQIIHERNMKRMYKTAKNYQDPRKKALNDYCHHRSTKWMYKHECKFVRKETNRKLRRMLRRNLYQDAYYRVIPHDYKTYGWITW